MQQVTPGNYLKELETLLRQECDKIKAYKQVYIEKGEFAPACKFRDIEKELLDFIKALEKFEQPFIH